MASPCEYPWPARIWNERSRRDESNIQRCGAVVNTWAAALSQPSQNPHADHSALFVRPRLRHGLRHPCQPRGDTLSILGVTDPTNTALNYSRITCYKSSHYKSSERSAVCAPVLTPWPGNTSPGEWYICHARCLSASRLLVVPLGGAGPAVGAAG